MAEDETVVEIEDRRRYAPQRVRVAGRLHGGRLVLWGGEALNVTFEVESGGGGLGRDVVVTGIAEFDPDGAPCRVRIERIELASARDIALWSTSPRPLLGPSRLGPEAGSGRGGLAAAFGRWPGDESDEEIAAALDAMS